MPAILVEGGFLSNATDSARVDDPAWRERLAQGIVTGIEAYKALAERRERPKLLADYRLESLTANVRITDASGPPPGATNTPVPAANPSAAAATPQP